MPVAASSSFSTPRLVAERIEQRHFDELRMLDGDPEVMKTLGGAVLAPEETSEALERNLARWRDHGYGMWMFYLADAHEFVGRGTLQHFTLDGNEIVELGYALRPTYWNQGYAPEMTGAMLQIGFEQLGMTEIYALTLPENRKSQRVMQKSGLTYQRDFIYREKWPSVLYRITADEWQSGR